MQSLNVSISGKALQQVETIKYLGVILDNCLSWKPHITNLRNKTSRIVGMLRRLHHIVPSTTIQILYNTIVLPSLDYCDVVWSGCSQEDSNKLEVVHNNAARAITGAPYRCSATALRKKLGWPTLQQRRVFHTVMWTFQCLNHLTPPYLDDVFVSTFKLHHYLTRQRNGIHLPNPRTNALKRSFGYMGATVWNSLPKHMQSIKNITIFKSISRKHILNL